MAFEKLLNKLCVIQTKSEVQTGLGEITTSWADTYTDVKCRYNRNKAPIIHDGSYKVSLEDYSFYFLVATTITKADQIVVDGNTFEVLAVFEDSKGHHKKVYARLKSYN